MEEVSGFEIMIPEWVVENEIAQGLTPLDVAQTYAQAMRKPAGSVDWARMNRAIEVKWGLKGLRLVKTRAWDYAEGRREFGK